MKDKKISIKDFLEAAGLNEIQFSPFAIHLGEIIEIDRGNSIELLDMPILEFTNEYPQTDINKIIAEYFFADFSPEETTALWRRVKDKLNQYLRIVD